MGKIICWSRVLPYRGLGQAVIVSCFYAVVVYLSPDGQENVDDVGRGF